MSFSVIIKKQNEGKTGNWFRNKFWRRYLQFAIIYISFKIEDLSAQHPSLHTPHSLLPMFDLSQVEIVGQAIQSNSSASFTNRN